MINDALDLIKRQQEQIKKLETIERFATKTIEKQTAEIERLNIRNKALTAITKNYDWKFAKVKVEAIKEFAWNLKSRYSTLESLDTICADEIREDIDNLVKEMTEVGE
jgi:Na+-translocating ferredoxin:NAD+ oxidoreductase RnfC subunit